MQDGNTGNIKNLTFIFSVMLAGKNRPSPISFLQKRNKYQNLKKNWYQALRSCYKNSHRGTRIQ